MTSFPSLCQTTRKTVIETDGDGLASHHRLAGEAGAEVLRSGEDAPLRTPRRTRPPHGDAALQDRQETE